MNTRQICEHIAQGQLDKAEALWMDALDDAITPDEVGEVLGAMNEAGQAETGETMGWALLDAQSQRPAEELLNMAEAAWQALPDSEELRRQTAALSRQVFGEHPEFDRIFSSAGVETGQSARRSMRTLRTCLALKPGCYLANRFDGRVICLKGYSEVWEEYEFEHDGEVERLEAKLLADEFDILDPSDFRVLRYSDPAGLAEKVQSDPLDILVGICIAHGGQTTSDRIKEEMLVGILDSGDWSRWWSRARTAARKTRHVSIEGRNPVQVSYHPQGRSVEEELADDAEAARHGPDYLSLVQVYHRELDVRGAEPKDEFLASIRRSMGEALASARGRRPVEALELACALEELSPLGITPPDDAPTVSDLLAEREDPAGDVAEIAELGLWPPALKALAQRDDAAACFTALLPLTPAELLEDVVVYLRAAGAEAALDEAVAQAQTDPLTWVELLMWLWQGPETPPSEVPGRVTLLTKLLQALEATDVDWQGSADERRILRQRVRSALSASNYEAFREALEEMDGSMAQVIRTKLERCDGLAQAVREKTLDLLRQKHYRIFLETKADPWEDDSVIWTTRKALDAQAEELRVLMEEQMPANAKQIGEAAEEGDLRENADWQAAIEERDMLVARARKIQGDLARTRILGPGDVPTDHIGIGSRVRLRSAADDETVELTFLGPWDSDPTRRVYSYTTRLAQGMMGKVPGAEVSLDLQGQGTEQVYVIEEIQSAITE